MNLKEHYKRRLQEDLQTPERAREMSRALEGEKVARRLGSKTGVHNAIIQAIDNRDNMEKRDPKLVYGKGGRVVGRVVPTKGSAARTK